MSDETSSAAQLRAIAGEWLGIDVQDVHLVTDGVNKNLRAKTSSFDVFLRFAPTALHSRMDLESEARLLKALELGNVPSCTVFDVNGSCVLGPTTVNGVEYNVLVNRTVLGEPLGATSGHLRSFGHSLACLHLAHADLESAQVQSWTQVQIDPVLREVFGQLCNELARLPAVGADEPAGVCHGDAWIGNAIMRNGTAILFDFEYAGFGELANDIATVVWSIRAEAPESESELFASFVEGYRAANSRSVSQNAMRRGLLKREIRNIAFLSRHIAMSREIKLSTIRFARETMEFALGQELSQFCWG